MGLFKLILIFCAAVLLIGCVQISTGFSKAKSFEQLPINAQVTVGITHVTLKSDSDKRGEFWENTFSVASALSGYEGYLGHKLRKGLLGYEGWTMTVWENDDALKGFIYGSHHQQAIAQSIQTVQNARFVRVTVPVQEIPLSWKEAEKLMDGQGRGLY